MQLHVKHEILQVPTYKNGRKILQTHTSVSNRWKDRRYGWEKPIPCSRHLHTSGCAWAVTLAHTNMASTKYYIFCSGPEPCTMLKCLYTFLSGLKSALFLCFDHLKLTVFGRWILGWEESVSGSLEAMHPKSATSKEKIVPLFFLSLILLFSHTLAFTISIWPL